MIRRWIAVPQVRAQTGNVNGRPPPAEIIKLSRQTKWYFESLRVVCEYTRSLCRDAVMCCLKIAAACPACYPMAIQHSFSKLFSYDFLLLYYYESLLFVITYYFFND